MLLAGIDMIGYKLVVTQFAYNLQSMCMCICAFLLCVHLPLHR